MANRDIIARMDVILDDYEAGRICPEDVERSIRFHVEALEALPYKFIKEADDLCARLVTAHMFMGEDEFIDNESVAKVLKAFRIFLASLPCNDAG